MDYDLLTVLSGQAGLAGLQWLLGESPVLQALQQSLVELLTVGYTLAGVQLQRAKFKPGRYLTLHYAIQLHTPQDIDISRLGMARFQVHPTDSQRDPVEALTAMQGDVVQRGIAAPFRTLVADDPHYNMWAQVSPLDPAFQQLARLSDPIYVRDLLADTPAIQSHAAYQISAIRYRPGERHVLRYTPLDAEGNAMAEHTLYAKIYNSDKGQRAFQTAAQVSDWLAGQGSEIGAVRPLAYIATEDLALYPHVSGTPLSDLLLHQDAKTGGYLRAAGAALQALHRTPASLVELKSHSLEKELKGIRSASEHIATLLPTVGTRIAGLLEQARELHERLPQEPYAFTYGDFKADHLWATPSGMTLIDFDTCYLYDPAIDLGKFLADVQFWYDTYGLTGVPEAQELFLAGYGAMSPERLLRARFYEALVLTKSTVRRVKLFDPNWAMRTERLIDRAVAVFDQIEATRQP